MQKRTANLIATVGGIGHLRPAPGTWGSAVAVLLGLGLYRLGHAWTLLAGTVVVTFLGLAAIRITTKGEADPDRSEIVIDEVAGQWLALCFPAFGFLMAGLPATQFPWPGWVVAFIGFRLFDIWKPGPVGWADRRGDAIGVMLDDLIAGVFAGILVVILAGISHGLLPRLGL